MPQVIDPHGREKSHLRGIVNFADMCVLEIGCGDGRLTHAYADQTSNIIGIDLKYDALVNAAYNHPQLSFMEASAINLPFPDKTFDVVLFAWSY